MNMNKAERIASKGLRYFFAPQMTGGMKGVRSLFAALVQTLAQTLVRAKLLPATHRALNPASVNDVRLGEVLAVSYANLCAPTGRKADQFAIFIAVFGLLALSTVYIFALILSTLIGVAHAAVNIPSYDPGACAVTVSPSIFDAPCTNDMAQQWINVLLLNDTTSWFYNQVTSLPLAAGMTALFGTYSVGMLVLAGVLVLYHVLAVVAETASQGHLGGRNFNQVWAPLRLVLAVGMLVPLGVSGGGLNSGQYMVTQFAKMGSGLASNAWAGFATSSANTFGNFIVMPTLPPVGDIVARALKIMVCESYLQNDTAFSSDPYNIAIVPPTGWINGGSATATSIYKTWDGKPRTGSSTISRICGAISLNNPDYEAVGTSVNFFSTGAGVNAGSSFREAILKGHKNAIDAAMTPGGKLDTLAKKIARGTDANVQYVLTESDMYDFVDTVEDYRNTIISAIRSNVSSTTSLADFAKDATARGWVSAAVWFNSIARINGQFIDASNTLPAVSTPGGPPLESLDTGNLVNILSALNMVDVALAELVSTMDAGSSTVSAPEADFADNLGVSVTQDSSDPLVIYLQNMAKNWKEILGKDAGAQQSVDMTAAVTGVSNFKLNTANPLAELAALGNRIINFALNAAKNADNCQSAAYGARKMDNFVMKPGSNDYYSYSEAQKGINAACGGSPTSTFIMASLTSSLMVSGFTLAFLLPLMPFIRFMFGLLTWIIALFEAVVAIPLVALAHIKTDGEGLSGPMARGAYLLILQIFARPILMVFGLIIALLVFNLMIVALNEMYAGALRSAEGGDKMSALSGIVYTVIYGCLAYAFANAAFKAIDLIPNQALQWIGGHSVAGIDESHRVASGVGQMGSMVGSAPGQLMNTARNDTYREAEIQKRFAGSSQSTPGQLQNRDASINNK